MKVLALFSVESPGLVQLVLSVRVWVRCLHRVLGVDLLPQLPALLCEQMVAMLLAFCVSVVQWLV